MRTRKGFTLVELLVVIAIIAILAAILFPVFAQARKRAGYAACISNMKQITMAILMYCEDQNGYGPSWGDGSQWFEALVPYTKHHGYMTDGTPDPLYTCPINSTAYGPVRYTIMSDKAKGWASWGDFSQPAHHVTWKLPDADPDWPGADGILYESMFLEYGMRWYVRNPACKHVGQGTSWAEDNYHHSVAGKDCQTHGGKNGLGHADGSVSQIVGSGW